MLSGAFAATECPVSLPDPVDVPLSAATSLLFPG